LSFNKSDLRALAHNKRPEEERDIKKMLHDEGELATIWRCQNSGRQQGIDFAMKAYLGIRDRGIAKVRK